ncbi:hypothetical protein BT96DRAFT_538340 [Gymnopus androsaceus JB14]|uniref:Hydrophobin n=1 Tax=Gymnopus androsaceus JB14 TaxID=1447944 RepID=A0A6A4I1Q1_9AGAR|nr:hypothetical protein BT96DRAFT_538340 [Gymnopus androsaceus JB14]
MKFTSALFLALTAVATSVSATPFHETNGERLARGLPPLPPQKRGGTPSYGNTGSHPSGSPGQCSSGATHQCCQSTGYCNEPHFASYGLSGKIPNNVLLGSQCYNLPYGEHCESQPVCCTENNYSNHHGLSYGCHESSY